MQVVGLTTTYQDADWLPSTLGSLSLLDGVVLVEGAYQETIALGKPPRSPDNTNQLCRSFCLEKDTSHRFFYEANEVSDVQQRNLALGKIKEHFGYKDVVAFIIDGDEEYTPGQIKEIRDWAYWMNGESHTLSGLIWSKVFVSPGQYVLHIFPRLFLVTLDCRFVDSNLMYWPEVNYTQAFSDQEDRRCKILPYHLATTHHSYTRSKERFDWKKAGRIARRGSFPWSYNEVSGIVERTDGRAPIVRKT